MNPILEFFKETNALFWIGIPVSFLVGYLANIFSAPRSKWYLDWISGRHFRTLLRLGRNEVIVVIPHQNISGDRRLPQVAVEDVLALRNVFEVFSCFFKKFTGPVGLRPARFRGPLLQQQRALCNARTYARHP